VIGTLRKACPGAPKRGCKDQNRQEKEDAGDFKPEDAAYSSEGAQKASHATGNAASDLSGSLTGSAVLSSSGGCSLRVPWRIGGFSAGGYALTRDAPGDAHADAQSAADGVRFHSIYDGSSDPWRSNFEGCYRFAVARSQRRK